MVWYGMVWYGMVWYGMVWYGMYVCMYVVNPAFTCSNPLHPDSLVTLEKFRMCADNAAQSGWDMAGSLRAMKTSVAA